MTVGFLCWQVQSLVAHVAAERAAGAASVSLRIQWERWTGKQKQRENRQRSLTHSDMHACTRTHTHRNTHTQKEMSHQQVCERALRGSNCIW